MTGRYIWEYLKISTHSLHTAQAHWPNTDWNTHIYAAYKSYTPSYIQHMLAKLTIDKPHDHSSIIFLSKISWPTPKSEIVSLSPRGFCE